MKIICQILTIFLFSFIFSLLFAAQNNNEPDNSLEIKKKLQVGEELTYVVKYSLIKLGEVKLKIISKNTEKGKTYYSAMAFIDSYSGIPFVNLHQIYETKIAVDSASSFFRGLVKGDEYTSFTDYNFDYKDTTIYIKKGKVYPHQLWVDSTTSRDKKYQDGLSIFYYARMNTGKLKVKIFLVLLMRKK